MSGYLYSIWRASGKTSAAALWMLADNKLQAEALQAAAEFIGGIANLL